MKYPPKPLFFMRATALAAVALLGQAQAQVVADPTAPGAQRPTVLKTANGLPLVNIRTPNVAGLSHNRYQRFDVDAQGAILNNGRSDSVTQLGGWVGANPWLATGGARLILNEVNSSDPSLLKGWVEVAGQRAELVIANPSGIQVNGAGFINGSRVTLSTGTPLVSAGALDAWRVQRGQIAIGGAGLDARDADLTAVLARAVQLNAGLWARQLQVVTGANTVDAASALPLSAATAIGPTPGVALDVALLGGMYAGQIRLIGTEAGLGVNLQGVLSAETGDLLLDIQGWLSQRGSLSASGHAQLRAQGPVTQQATGRMDAERLTLSSPATVSLHGELLATSGMALTAAQLDLSAARLNLPGPLALTASAALLTDGAQLQAGAITARAGSVSNRGGTWVQTGSDSLAQGVDVQAAGLFDNTGGSVGAAAGLRLASSGLTNDGGGLKALGDAHIDTRGGALLNRGGRIGAQGALALDTGELINAAEAGQGAFIGAGRELHVRASALRNRADTAADGTPLHAALWADRNVDIQTQGALLNAGQVFAGEGLSIAAGELSNSGTLEAGTLNAVVAGGLHNTSTGSLLAGRAMALAAGTLDNQGLINVAAGGALQVRAGTLNNGSGGAIFADHLAIEAGALNNRPDGGPSGAPVIAARESLLLGVGTLNNEDGALIYSGGDMAVAGGLYGGAYATGQAEALNNLSADIEALGDLDLRARALRNERRQVAVSTVDVIDQTAQLHMPAWWSWYGKNEFGAPIEATSNYTRQLYYLLDPSAILSDEAVITPDGNRLRRLEVALDPSDSVFHAASGAYAGYRGVRERFTVGQAGTVVLYASLRRDGVANPDQVSGAPDPTQPEFAAVSEWQSNTLTYSPAFGRCSSQCSLLVVQPGYQDPLSDLLRSDHTNLVPSHPGLEIWRSARHTAVEDRLNADAGAPASIRAAGSMGLGLSDSYLNRYGDILAGAALQVDAPGVQVNNEGLTLKRAHRFQITTHTAGLGVFDWVKPDISEAIGQLGGRMQGGQLLSIQALDLNNTEQGRGTGLAGTGAPGTLAPVHVPASRLFQRAEPGRGYLVETDARFTERRQWLGSDYLLGQLASEPAATLKRLGDGFYEQKLVREQLAELTGKRFLNEFDNDEAQFRALMDAGLAYARAFELKPGVALTAQQMAQLSTDLVWLVQQEVVLADGTRTQALVPRLYLRSVPRDELLPSGAVLAGRTVLLDIQRDLLNLGGRIEGDTVLAQAGRDLSNIGGLMQARVDLLAKAGRNVTVSSPTHTTSFSSEGVQQSRTELAGVGELRVGDGAGARLHVEAGQDVLLQGARVGNASASGSTRIDADRNVRLQTVGIGDAMAVEHDANNFRRSGQTQEVGSSVAALGDIQIRAGQDVVASGASVQALGDVGVQAGRDIRVEAGRATSDSASSVVHKRSNLVSEKSTEQALAFSSDVATGSLFEGANVVVDAGRDIRIEGSSVSAQDLLLLDARRDVRISAAQNQESSSAFTELRKSGVLTSKQGFDVGSQSQSDSGSTHRSTQAGSRVSGGELLIVAGRDAVVKASTVVADGLLSIDAVRDVSIVAGVKREIRDQSRQSQSSGVNVMASGLTESVNFMHDTREQGDGQSSTTSASASLVGSLQGDVVIRAGRRYRQTGSDVLAREGDVDIQAEKVDITEARETRHSTSQQSSQSTVLGATPRNALVDAIKSARSTAEVASATGETSDSRVQALGVAATALNAYNTANQVAGLVANPSSAAGVTIDFNLGSNKSRSESTETLDAGRASSVAAAGDVRIRATGAGQDSDILIRGSELSGGRDVLLKADGDVQLESSQDERRMHGSGHSSGASVGVGIGVGATTGITLNASASQTEGSSDGHDLVQRNTHLVAGQTTRFESGGDTRLAGAVVSGETVQADVGGDLLIESRQDTSRFKSDQNSSGWSVSLCIPPICYGASSVGVAGGAQNIESEFASVGEQSGLRAGDGGFQVNVKGDTTLKGAAITSSDQAVEEGKNRLERGGELILREVENHARYKGTGYELNVSVAVQGAQATAPEQQAKGTAVPAKNEGSAGIAEDSREVKSTTKSAISGMAGDKTARTGDAESGLQPIFDQAKVQQELDAQIKVTAEFGKGAGKAWGEYANKQFTDAVEAGDEKTAACWAPDGGCRASGHAVIGGLVGGAAGAVGAGASSLTAPAFSSLLKDIGIPAGMAEGLTTAYAAGMGAVSGGAAGAVGAVNEAANNNAQAARLILGTVEAAGPWAARRCLRSPSCVEAVGSAGVQALSALASVSNSGSGSGDGPSLGDVNPHVFGGGEAGLPADTFGTPPNGGNQPPEDDNHDKNTKTIQKGGRTLSNDAANQLNETSGQNLNRREWGRAIEELKKENGLRGDDHGILKADGSWFDSRGVYRGNVIDYIK